MATLVSPGVSVSVNDESFYAAAGAGTVPLIVIATAEDKKAPDGSTTASYTTAANAGKLYQITSQRELLQSYGNPVFKKSGTTALHGDERNELGLMAAYSFLGIANRAYVLRANIDLDDLSPSATAPGGPITDGTYWLDTDDTAYGVYQYVSSAWAKQTVKIASSSDLDGGNAPKSAFGVNGEICVVNVTNAGASLGEVKFYQKLSGVWYHIGASNWSSAVAGSAGDFQFASHLSIPSTKKGGGGLTAGDIHIRTSAPNNGSNIVLKKYSTSSSQWVSQSVAIDNLSSSVYTNTYTSPKAGDIWGNADGESDLATINITKHNGGTSLTVSASSAISDTATPVAAHAGKVSINLFVNDGSAIPVTFTSNTAGNASVDDIVTDINNAISSANATLTFSDTLISSNVSGKVTLTVSNGRDLKVSAGNVSGYTPANLNITAGTYSNFEDLVYEVGANAPSGAVVNGKLWYDNNVSNTNIDILYQNSGTWATWTGDVQFSASEPSKQSDGSSSLSTGDIWIDSSDLENFPKIYKYSATSVWVLVDNKDQVTADGILFADFRASASGSLISSANGLPNAALYPSGMLAWNKMASVGNVKQYDSTSTLWKDFSGNKVDGSPYMMRKAQRRAVVTKLQSVVAGNQDIRNETNRFNIMACPGYPELIDEMVSLGTERKETVFTIGDAPLRLASDATSTSNWATNANTADVNGEDGLISSSAYAGVYYPHALATDLDGSNVLVPGSHMALRTFAFNDQVAFPWFAPAGFQRGLVNNASNVGYLDATSGEFIPVALSEGQRDSLYNNKINPIGNFPGRGIAVFGQKTLNPTSSALDRVNVARLTVYIRERLDDIVKPFLFEPNDEVTRANAKSVVDRFLGQLVSQRGLFDFITVCDTTNNTPARIDRNELHIDIAVQPVKAVEFIYIPVRIQNTLGSTA